MNETDNRGRDEMLRSQMEPNRRQPSAAERPRKTRNEYQLRVQPACFFLSTDCTYGTESSLSTVDERDPAPPAPPFSILQHSRFSRTKNSKRGWAVG